MCLRIDLNLDSEADDVKELEYRRGLLARLADTLGTPETSSCIQNLSESSSSKDFHHEHQNKPTGSLQIHVESGQDQDIHTPETSLSADQWSVITRMVEIFCKKARAKLREIGQRAEGIKDELFLALIGLTGQNAMQILPSSSTSCNIAMAANCTAFLLLLSGVLLRSKSGSSKWVGNMLALLGIWVTAAGIVFRLSMNIPGVGSYLVPFACLLPVIGALS